MFEYLNGYNLRIKSTSPGVYEAVHGVYACDSNWHNNVRPSYENQAYTGAAAAYSKYLAANPIPWPASLTNGRPPSQTFSLKVRFRV
jgi:hypothetical protein